MSIFARDRRSPDRRSAAQVVALPRRRAFDLIENLALEQRGSPKPAETPLSAVEARLAEALSRIVDAMAPTRDEVLQLAARHGIPGSVRQQLADPALAALIAERLPYRAPDEADCRAYYDAHAAEFRAPNLHEGSEILIGGDVTDRDWRSEAYGRAERITAMLLYDRRIFRDLVIYAEATSGGRGGRIGPVAEGAWESEVAAPFFSLKAGEVFPLPVPSSEGFHILAKDRVKPGRAPGFGEIMSEVARRLTERSRIAAARCHLASLALQTDR